MDLEQAFRSAQGAIRACANPVIGVDISSMPRRAIADIVEWLASQNDVSADVHFLYCPGEFATSALAARRSGPLSAAPISKFFAGSLRSPSIPIGLVLGLGLEPYRALGVIEFLEPARVWLFAGRSGDARFEAAAWDMHHSLIDATDSENLYQYDIRSLSDTYQAVESLSFSVGLSYRLILAPSGPKLFSLACLLVGSSRDDSRPAVWRVGNSEMMMPMEVEEAGDVAASVVHFDAAVSTIPGRSVESLG
ncbi:hypothetical protein [Mycolicibacterium pulveris]|uniref:hypothetical protein n=1 Tax=Mycolicibacterium pulveris TaxID=36813 RepID=UPI003CE792C9